MVALQKKPRTGFGPAVLEIEGLGLEAEGRTVLHQISLRVRAGDIFAVAGVDGNGQHELAEILAGARPPTRGRILVKGQPARGGATGQLAVIPQNREQVGLILDMELWENLLLQPALRHRLQTGGVQRRAAAIDLCGQLIQRFAIRTRSPRQRAADLSGGHRQRLMVARAIAAQPAVLAAHDLTRGLDVSATAEVSRAVRGFADQGAAVLLLSSDLDEVFELGDRVGVLSRGRLFEVSPADRTAERVGLLMAGASP